MGMTIGGGCDMGSTALAGGPTASPTNPSAIGGASGTAPLATLGGGPAGATLGADALGQITTALGAIVQALQGLVQAISSMISGGGALGGGGLTPSKVPLASVGQLGGPSALSLPAVVSAPAPVKIATPQPVAAPQVKVAAAPPATATVAS